MTTVSNMQVIIAPTTAFADLVNGVYYSEGKFYNRYGDVLTTDWVCYCVWSKENSNHGDKHATTVLKNFCKKYSITAPAHYGVQAA